MKKQCVNISVSVFQRATGIKSLQATPTSARILSQLKKDVILITTAKCH